MKLKFAIVVKSLFIMWLLLSADAYGQAPVKIEHYSTEDGLSHDIITCMFKDREGYMWFGTWNGINRFDGHNFTAFTSAPGDLSQIKNDRVDQIFEDTANHLWIKSYDGQVYRFDKGSEQFTPLSTILNLKQKILFDRILSADDGMLWVSTFDHGIIAVVDVRLDYSKYYTFAKSNTNGNRLPSDTINFFYKENQSKFWVGTAKGLVRITKTSPQSFTAKEILSGTPPDNFTAAAGQGGNLYFGTLKGELLIYDQRTGSSRIISAGKGRINAVLVGRKSGNVYMTSSLGELIIYDPLRLTTTIEKYTPAVGLHSIFEDRKGNLWLEPQKRGVIHFDVNTKVFHTFLQNNDARTIIPNNHFKVFEDKNGTVWSILRDGGFGYYEYATGKFKYFYNEPGSLGRQYSNLVSVAFYDKSGVMWLHTDQRGLEKVIFNPNDFKQQLLVDPGVFKTENEVRGLLCDRKNRLWVGAKSGILYLYQDGRRVNLTFTDLPKEGLGMVYNIFQDRSGAVWLGTKEKGVFRAVPLNKEETNYQLTHFSHDPANKHSISSDQIYSIVEDKQGRIWIGTFDKGLNLYQPSQGKNSFLRFIEKENGYPLGFNKIRHMATNNKGNLWIGTTDGLVIAEAVADNQFKFSTYSKQPGDIHSLGNNDIQYIYKDHQDRMWLATSGGGLNLAIEGKSAANLTFKVFSTKNGLGNNYILSLGQDNHQNLWVATKSTLSRFDPTTEKFHNFNSYDGVPTNGFSESSCTKMLDGRMVFGTIRGFLTFDPGKIKYHPIHANIVFTGLQINNEDVTNGTNQGILKNNINNTKEIRLKHNENIISLDYAILDYRSGNRQSYLYRLKGFDTTWHANKNQRRASYTNLPPGNYEFEVKAPHGENYTNIPAKNIKITILPPPWKTWWAYMIYALLFLTALEVARRIVLTILRLRQGIAVEHKITELKMAFFTNVSHELRTPLTLILNPIDEILKKERLSGQGMEYISIVQRNALRMVRFVNQLLDMRKAQSGHAKLNVAHVELNAFINEIAGYFKEAAKTNKIDLSVISDGNVEIDLDPEKMETVIYNLLSNAFKFSPDGKSISISIKESVPAGFMEIEVSDEGCGVPEKDLEDIFLLYHESIHPATKNLKGSGIGLALAKEFVELHRGTISAANRVNGGLSVTVRLPFSHKMSDDLVTEIEEEDAILDGDSSAVEREDSHAKMILLVEDNDDMRTFLSAHLRSVYRVRTAPDGLKGLAMARGIQPDVILSDIMMPNMDGIEMLDHLRNDPATSHIPVILLSAKTAVQSQIEGLRYGADFYISKPFNNELLFAAIANIIEHRKRLVERMMSGQKVMDLSPGQVIVTSKDEVFLQKVIDIVEARMVDPNFNIDAVAETINMARATFFKKFKSLTQQPPVEFVRDMRLKRAKQYLDAGTGNITEISYSVGFSSAKYFSTCFKAKYKVSPSDYLKSGY